jgi:DNA-binding CsgD family transcriptional regulator
MQGSSISKAASYQVTSEIGWKTIRRCALFNAIVSGLGLIFCAATHRWLKYAALAAIYMANVALWFIARSNAIKGGRPVRGGANRPPPTRLQPAAVAAVFIGAPPDAQDGADALAAAFGLTPAETKVLANLFAGRALAETAETLGITRPTAKTHLEHIFLKTGVTRQAELMRLWTGLISPTGSTRVSG